MKMAHHLQFLTLTLFCHFPGNFGLIKTYGQNCESGVEPCLGQHVTCLASVDVCGCSSPEDMIYDHSVRDCVLRLGRTCNERSPQCIEGANCDKNNGICRCESGYYASSVGVCLQQKHHNESCFLDVECVSSSLRQLVCVDGTCQCDQSKGEVFSEDKQTCVGLVDTECFGDDCTEHAECYSSAFNNGKMSCQCLNGFSKNSHGRCDLAYGQSCGTKKAGNCSDIYFVCINGNCVCKYPLHQIYHEQSKECLSLVSGPCTFPKNLQVNFSRIHNFQKCTKNAHCVDKGFYSECECNTGFVPTKFGYCSPGFGSQCEGDCDPDGTYQLYCRNGVCDCLDGLQIYDPSVKKCRGLVGARCTGPQMPGPSPHCIEYASCIMHDQDLPGKCICDKYSREVANRTCDIAK